MNHFWQLLNTPMREDWRALAVLVAVLVLVVGAFLAWGLIRKRPRRVRRRRSQ
jgi:membrane-anchored protein YejM (alkaline phosphatase superfamily)